MRNDNRKWQKRPQLYRGRFFYLRHVVHAALILCAAVSVISLLLYFERSDTLFIRRIEVLGELKHINKDEVIRLSRIRPDDKLFSVDLRQVTEDVSRYPWVASVKVRREFPDTIQIHVSEREPAAVLSVDGELYYTDGTGKVFKKLSPADSADWPVISGFERDFVGKYPTLATQYLRQALDFLGVLRSGSFYGAYPVSEVRFDPVAGFTVFTAKEPFEIYYGRDGAGRKQRKLDAFFASKRFEASKYVRFDLDAKDRVVARELPGLSEATRRIL